KRPAHGSIITPLLHRPPVPLGRGGYGTRWTPCPSRASSHVREGRGWRRDSGGMSVSSNGSKGHQRRLKRQPDTNGNATATQFLDWSANCVAVATQFLDWSASCRSIPPNCDGLGVKTRFTGRVPNPTAFLTTPTPCPMNTRNGLEITSPTHRHRVATTASYSIHPFVTIVTRSASSLPPLTPSVA